MTVKYTEEHEWIQLEDHEAAVVGITLHAQEALGDVVFVDLPEVGRSFAKGEVAGVVESVKAAADIYMPVAGEVTEVNEELRADPALANRDPMGNGWFFKILIKDMAEFDVLMDEPAAGLPEAEVPGVGTRVAVRLPSNASTADRSSSRPLYSTTIETGPKHSSRISSRRADRCG